ncbi:hypothetical protein JQX08_06330 [Pseudomonas sp. UL073]|uniref:Secreted protein n=1 Tax=Zestomonas insulae TaxID=2809017 RepID=A0ABS2IBH7_9GAMM|nr:hypothetical protein [Pseudomonas insulae]MBM7060317.1 hypothetical protein [Pseudomonas insulae]
MSRYLRFCLISLLCLALPLTGLAGATAAAQPCAPRVDAPTVTAEAAHDCCLDLSCLCRDGKSCPGGSDCKTSSAVLVAFSKPPIMLFSPITHTAVSGSLLIPAPSGRWRPPRT